MTPFDLLNYDQIHEKQQRERNDEVQNKWQPRTNRWEKARFDVHPTDIAFYARQENMWDVVNYHKNVNTKQCNLSSSWSTVGGSSVGPLYGNKLVSCHCQDLVSCVLQTDKYKASNQFALKICDNVQIQIICEMTIYGQNHHEIIIDTDWSHVDTCWQFSVAGFYHNKERQCVSNQSNGNQKLNPVQRNGLGHFVCHELNQLLLQSVLRCHGLIPHCHVFHIICGDAHSCVGHHSLLQWEKTSWVRPHFVGMCLVKCRNIFVYFCRLFNHKCSPFMDCGFSNLAFAFSTAGENCSKFVWNWPWSRFCSVIIQSKDWKPFSSTLLHQWLPKRTQVMEWEERRWFSDSFTFVLTFHANTTWENRGI